MPDFIRSLPPEIVTDVLLLLNQKDCIECMRVCQSWFSLIPSCATRLWSELIISYDSWPKANYSIFHCLGAHVKTVSIRYPDTWNILKRLEQKKCFAIKTLNEYDTFYTTIQTLANTLTQLFINFHPYDISLTMLLDVLPNLTHLSVKFNKKCHFSLIHDEPEVYKQRKYVLQQDSEEKRNIVYLCLDNTFDFNTRIQPVLRRCPRLEFFLISDFHKKKFATDLPAHQIQTTLRLCSSIRYILWNVLINAKNFEREWLSLSMKKKIIVSNDISDITKEQKETSFSRKQSNDSKEGGGVFSLQEFVYSGALYQQQLVPILTKSRNTLQRIHLSFLDVDQIQSNMKHLYFPRLKSLELVGCNEIIMENLEWFDCCFFQMHQQQLEELKIELDIPLFPAEEEEGDGSGGLDNIVEVISKNLKRIKYLCLSVTCFRDDICCRTMNLFSYNNLGLQHIELSGIPIANQGLLSLTKLPQLQKLTLSGPELYRYLTEDGFIEFAHSLKEQNTIQSLQLWCAYTVYVTDIVLEQFARIDSLRILRISGNTIITDAGVNAFGNIVSSNSSDSIRATVGNSGKENSTVHRRTLYYKKKLELYACWSVSSQNPNAVFVSYSNMYRD
ncbi:hypothetical protein BDC45DRAFT_575321 [Circinella umbellata]|nr:hypothetical protein BDC45DRAFT_575321 [Circinella umbellata]